MSTKLLLWVLLIWVTVANQPLQAVSDASETLGLAPNSSAVADESTETAASSASARYPKFPTSAILQKALERHNALRAGHGAGPLKWSNTLAASAGASAARCGSKAGYGTSRAGENRYYLTRFRSDPVGALSQAIDFWYQESNKYDFDKPGHSESTRHFTQVVWKSTTRVGCAVQDCSHRRVTRGNTLVVCHYSPPGNVHGSYHENVMSGLTGWFPFPRHAPPPPPPSPPPPPPPPPPPRPPPNHLNSVSGQSNGTLKSPACLMSSDQRFTFCMQNDGNLVLYQSDAIVLWQNSGDRVKNRSPPYRLVLTDIGALIEYDVNGNVVWSTKPISPSFVGDSSLVCQSDGNVVLYYDPMDDLDEAGRIQWATNTCCH